MKKPSLEKRMRALEYFHDLRLLPRAWPVVRVDGRSFSRFTDTRFEKPYDETFRDLMLATAKTLLEELHGIYAYTQSDEISVLFPPTWDLFDREVEKIVSVSAGIASAAFTHQALVRLSEKQSENADLREVLIQIIHELSERLISPLPSDYKNFSNDRKLVELLLQFVSYAKDKERTTLLLIDNYDLFPNEQQRWFQENFLSPATRTKKFAVVLTSQTELRFTESFELRMRLESRELKGLDSETISLAFPEYKGGAEEIYKVTGGVPNLTAELIEQLVESQIFSSDEFKTRAQEITGKYYRMNVEENFLGTFPAETRETMLILALLSRFDVKVLKQVLPNLMHDPYQSYGTADYLNLIDRLRPWVEWRRKGGYSLNPAFQLMLQGYISTSKPDLYKKVKQEISLGGFVASAV